MSGVQQYLRKFSLVVSGGGKALDFADFRCVFSVRRGDIQTPNSCSARLYNLSIQTARTISGAEFDTITIRAGYEGNFAQVFTGAIKQVRTGRVDARDSYVDITAADGDKPYNFAIITENLASAAPATVMGQINAAYERAGGIVGAQPNFGKNRLPRGKVLYGALKNVTREVADQTSCTWSIQDNAVTFIPKTAMIAAPPVLISSKTGLIGVPEQTANGIEIEVLLNPSIKIGTGVQLVGDVNKLLYGLSNTQVAQNKTLQKQVALNKDGLYYVMVAEHEGDTRGEPWFTRMICLAVDAGLPPDIDLSNRLFASTDSIPRVL